MKKYIFTLYICAAVLLVGVAHVYAVENTFKTQLAILSDDFIAPSIPTGLVATPISSSRIDLVWNASTDNISVSGYRIFRDGSIIATTSATVYQNTGLTASTTYSYTVEAFDSTPNYSGQSAVTSTTTSDQVVTPIATTTTDISRGGSNGGDYILLIKDLITVPYKNSSIVNFSTNQPAHAKVYWGLTEEYEIGSIAGLFYGFTHSVKIDGLEPSTNYFFKVEVINSLGKTQTLTGSFQTQNIFTESLLTNVTNFKATPLENSITLNWSNPKYNDFDSVRIIRSDKFFPRDIYDGQVVYEGRDEIYNDTNVNKGVTYYYSAFAKDSSGNYSSGALAQARIKLPGEIDVKPTDPFAGIKVLENVHPDIEKLSLIDFDFIQDGRKLVNIGNRVAIDGTKNLTISLDYNKVPEILKTIAVTLIDPEDPTKVFPFLLRVNKDKTAYDAVLAPLGRSGKYGLSIIILDYKNQGLKRFEGTIQALVFNSFKNIGGVTGYRSFILWIILITLIIVVLYFATRRKNRKQNEAQ